MRSRAPWLAIGALLLLTAPQCTSSYSGADAQHQDAGAAAGTERGDCYPNGTCNAGLQCLSRVCVTELEAKDAGNVVETTMDASAQDAASDAQVASACGTTYSWDRTCFDQGHRYCLKAEVPFCTTTPTDDCPAGPLLSCVSGDECSAATPLCCLHITDAAKDCPSEPRVTVTPFPAGVSASFCTTIEGCLNGSGIPACNESKPCPGGLKCTLVSIQGTTSAGIRVCL